MLRCHPCAMDCYVVEGTAGSVQRRPLPELQAGDALVRVLIAGVCNTDLEILKGYMGFAGVLGHEFVGICEEAPTRPEMVGKRVVGEINLACAACGVCAGGGARARNHCPTRTVLGIMNKDGAYAQYLTLPVANLHVVPDHVSSQNAAFMEPLAAACRILEQGLVKPGDRVAVVGDGKLGLLCAEVLGRQQPAVLFGRHPEKMKLLSSAAQVECRAPEEATPGLFDVVVDATGSPAGLDLSRQLCQPLGTLVLKSTCAAGADFNTAPFVIDELRVVGSRCGPFDTAMKLLEEGLDLTPLITATFPLAEAEAALALARTKGTIKVQIRVSEERDPRAGGA